MNFRELKKSEQNVVTLFSTINFGRIENLIVENGLLKKTPNSKQILTRHFKRDDNKHSASRPDGDFILKEQLEIFFERIHCMGNGTIRSITIQYGLPVYTDIEEPVTLL